MGSWGHGVFENDEAADFFDEYQKMLLKEIAYRIAPEQAVL